MSTIGLVIAALTPELTAASLICSGIKYWSFTQVVPVLIISIYDNILAQYISSLVSLSSIGQILSFSHSYSLHPSVVSLNMLIGI